MLKKILVTLLSIFFILGGSFAIVALVFLLIPRHDANANISLPQRIEDSVVATSSTQEETEESGYDNIYVADVHQSLTLRSQASSSSEPVMEEGLAPMTHMQVLNMIEGTSFAYVKIINGNYKGKTGYVNCDYITKLGEPTIRIGTEE